MKKCILVLLTVFFMVFPAVSVGADVIAEPENSFYQKNKEKCVLLRRSFRADGKISVKDAPDSKKTVSSVENGEIILIEYSCLYDGEYWGTIIYENDNFKGGWVEMKRLSLIYDYISFEEDHFNEFYSYTGDFKEIKEAGEVILWTWPGSGKSLSTINNKLLYFSVSRAFKDDQGREWGVLSSGKADRKSVV